MATVTTDATTAREKLFHFIEGIEDTRAVSLYEFLKVEMNEEEDNNLTYNDEFVAELDKRWGNYKNGGKSYSEEEFKERTHKLRTSIK